MCQSKLLTLTSVVINLVYQHALNRIPLATDRSVVPGPLQPFPVTLVLTWTQGMLTPWSVKPTGPGSPAPPRHVSSVRIVTQSSTPYHIAHYVYFRQRLRITYLYQTLDLNT